MVINSAFVQVFMCSNGSLIWRAGPAICSIASFVYRKLNPIPGIELGSRTKLLGQYWNSRERAPIPLNWIMATRNYGAIHGTPRRKCQRWSWQKFRHIKYFWTSWRHCRIGNQCSTVGSNLCHAPIKPMATKETLMLKPFLKAKASGRKCEAST